MPAPKSSGRHRSHSSASASGAGNNKNNDDEPPSIKQEEEECDSSPTPQDRIEHKRKELVQEKKTSGTIEKSRSSASSSVRSRRARGRLPMSSTTPLKRGEPNRNEKLDPVKSEELSPSVSSAGSPSSPRVSPRSGTKIKKDTTDSSPASHGDHSPEGRRNKNEPKRRPRSNSKLSQVSKVNEEEGPVKLNDSSNYDDHQHVDLSIPHSLIAWDERSNREIKVSIVVDRQTIVKSQSSEAGSARKRTRSMDADRDGSIKKASGPSDDGAPSEDSIVPATAPLQAVPLLGTDGNLFHCNVCGGFGDVVCCDGCPNVYHQECIPKSDPSRISLDRDEEPWYCPDCFPEKSKNTTNDKKKSTPTHTSSTKAEAPSTERNASSAVEPGSEGQGTKTVAPERRSTRKRKKSFHADDEYDFLDNDDEISVTDNEDKPARKASKSLEKEEQAVLKTPVARRRTGTPRQASSGKRQRLPSSAGSLASVPKSRSTKKKKNKDTDIDSPLKDPLDGQEEAVSLYGLHDDTGLPRATPGFFLFLRDNRTKIERSLARKHRNFHRMPRSFERNALVANEGAHWWVKLPPSEVRRYITVSIREYERRIVAWKEEKSLRNMMNEDSDGPEDSTSTSISQRDFTRLDERHMAETHTRLYLGTDVGSRPFSPEKGESYNLVLLELLQDMRFNPLPMFSATRTEAEHGQMDISRLSIPHFDVDGPVSTSIGDECLGCTRGWTHHCNVLRRKIPSIEFRAQLQPPLSSLMASRVGIGMRMKPDHAQKSEEDTEEEGKNAEVFSTRDTYETSTVNRLPVAPWNSMTKPSLRGDDIASFIEETVAMKIPEPSRPTSTSGISTFLDSAKKSLFTSLPNDSDGGAISDDGKAYSGTPPRKNAYKCGRCRSVVQSDVGCTQCRRAQLVLNMARKVPDKVAAHGPSPENKQKSPTRDDAAGKCRLQTRMLGRITLKEGTGECLPEGDQAVADWIVRQRWMPRAILPPTITEAPTTKVSPGRRVISSSTSDLESSHTMRYDASEPEKSQQKSFPRQQDPGSHMDNGNTADESSENSIDEIEHDESMKLRERKSRKDSLSIILPEVSQTDLQKYAQKQKKEFDGLQKKCLEVSTRGILLGLMRRDPLRLFATTTSMDAPGYRSIIKMPIDFDVIRRRVQRGEYTTIGSFIADCRLLCDNALTYNLPGSIYYRTAKELRETLAEMHNRANDWIGAIKDAHAEAWRNTVKKPLDGDHDMGKNVVEAPFRALEREWPEAVEMLEESEWLYRCISSDFIRTKENESAYYGSLAIRRTAAAADAALAPYPNATGLYHTVSKRSHREDNKLREVMDKRAAGVPDPVQLKDLPSSREELIIRVLRRTQARRIEGFTGSETGCARCDGMRVNQELKTAMTIDTGGFGKQQKKSNTVSRVSPSRIDLTTGLASENLKKRVNDDKNPMYPDVIDVAVSVKGSDIHGWGLYADQPFSKGDVVAEYIGEYVSSAVTEAREKQYREERIQDYQFRLDDKLVIDATKRGGCARYINHNCSPNCVTKVISGKAPNEHLKRLVIVANRDIKPREELSYDYKFPLELDTNARIPCNCHSEQCRGFMNWDMPEKGSNTKIVKGLKRGANMRDRIRRLGRPLKGDKDIDA